MGKVRRFFVGVKDFYGLLWSKKYTTIAGTLVFFLIMSIMPMAFWVTLLFGKNALGGDKILSLPAFDTVKEVLLFVKKEAESATEGASVLLLVTTLYSSTNLFYQMRRTGEIIYDYPLKSVGWKMRISALGLLVLTMLVVVLVVLFFTSLSFLFSRILSAGAGLIFDGLLLAIGAFALVLLLNVYVCPYKVPASQFLSGALVTVGLWTAAIFGFAVYLQFSNISRLYGALSVLIVFLLWLYLLMIGFVVGVILNSKRIVEKSWLYNC